VGAGDSFMAGILAALEDGRRLVPAAAPGFPEELLGAALDFAMRVAAVTCSRAGADPPRREEL
jgi:fructokinase